MFKKVFIFCLSVIYLFVSFWAFALSNSQKWAILDLFKEKQYELLFESNLWNLEDDEKEIFNLAKKVNLFNNISNNVLNDMKGFENKSLKNLSKIESLEEQIKTLDKEIKNTNDNINKLNFKVVEIKDSVESTKNIVELISEKIKVNNEILLKYLVYIYKKWNNVYKNDEMDNLKSILLNWEKISDIIDDLYFKWIIETKWKELINKHKLFISELYLKKIELERKEETVKNIRNSLIVNRKVIKDKKEFKDSLLKVSKWKQLLYEKYIDKKIDVEKNIKLRVFKEQLKFDSAKETLLEKYDCEFVDASKNSLELEKLSENCLTLNKIIYAESKLKWFGKIWINIFSWPIKPTYGLSAYYRDIWYKKYFSSDHDAIDIIAKQWTSVRAPADWYVIYIEPPETPDYSYLAIKHSDWYVSVYWHLSEISVREYDFVKQGQIIAKTGWEYWTNWAGYITTWPHLHFELYNDKKSIDPLNFLSLADFPYKYLIEKYRFKFYTDYKEKKGFVYEDKSDKSRVFKLNWNTEIERQKDLIDKYAVWDFRNWQIWVDESLIWNIDPTFVMCIWLAESWLWKYLKTPYNVWNIWNTDSWATTTFENARSWIYYMISTLNNNYLWKYNEIKDLSRYGNKDWQIYASSPDNWHNNIITCMSHIKWRFIPDDYNFRIIK